jgi:cytidine deaminase
VENASYGATICAERTAIVKAVTQGQKNFKAIGVASDLTEPCSPCGICRQFIREFSSLDLPVYMFTTNGEYKMLKLEQLLPMSFGPEHLS